MSHCTHVIAKASSGPPNSLSHTGRERRLTTRHPPPKCDNQSSHSSQPFALSRYEGTTIQARRSRFFTGIGSMLFGRSIRIKVANAAPVRERQKLESWAHIACAYLFRIVVQDLLSSS